MADRTQPRGRCRSDGRVAFAMWEGRIAPVFDVARHLTCLEIAQGEIVNRSDHALPASPPAQRITRLCELGIQVLVCGAISRPLHMAAQECGIRVVPFVAGTVETVLGAWLAGGDALREFSMPGCGHGRGRRCRRQPGASGEMARPPSGTADESAQASGCGTKRRNRNRGSRDDERT